ncbi:MAG: endonuclease MutS2 [Paludibacteraceae bacterium]
MLYPRDIEEKIGFDKIRQILKNLCISTLAQEEIDGIAFTYDFDTIVAQLTPIAEATQLLTDGTPLPIGDTADLRPMCARTRIEGTFLDIADIEQIGNNCRQMRQIADFIGKIDSQRFSTLNQLTTELKLFPDILREIDNILDKFGNIKDTASPALAQIRHDMRQAQVRISRTLHTILRQAQTDGLVEKDAAPTMRDGRIVIPVPSMNKRHIGGIVHDESATGKTAYIEPGAVVEANNRLRELESAEQHEIRRILTQFTDLVRPYYPELLTSTHVMAQIDALQAKATFAQRTKAIKPHLKNEAHIHWYDARHPLLELSLAKQGKEIVPLNIRLTRQQRILLISGPNAGGKSVCLKTTGLLQYMLQCGLPIPVSERSEAGIFESIFIDIGDEQSIENDLSTYSSHLLNMKTCLRHCNEKSLLLVDEFGTGTEPQIGGALAEAMLEKFNTCGTFGLITTHYTNLKHFAANTDGIVNGAMLYDRHRLQPLFCLQIGQPGSSFAIEIARQIGLPNDLIQSASQKIGTEHIDYDKNLQDAARDKRYWENKRQKIREKEKEIDALRQQYEQRINELKHKQKEMLRTAKTQANELIEQANAQIERTIRTIKETQADKQATKAIRRELEDFRKTTVATSATANKNTILPIKIGDRVAIKGQNVAGNVLSFDDKTAIVAFGQLKSTIARTKLEPYTPKTNSNKSNGVGTNTIDTIHQRSLTFRQEIDVRGMHIDEALTAVMYFIDDAEMLACNTVRILHGTGTGALRQAIRDYLHNASAVKSYHDEHIQLGGAGITVVEMK